MPQEAPAPVQSVEIKAAPSPTRLRQEELTARSVFGREELDKYGDTSVSEVLKRLPGVTVDENKGKGLQIRMRGLGNGYTQILLNGEATPAGFAVDAIAPDMIERIEVLRVAGADMSAQAIAGTINIVLRKKSAKQGGEFKISLSRQAGKSSPNLSWNTAGETGTISYGISASAEANRQQGSKAIGEFMAQGAPDSGTESLLLARHLQQENQGRRDALNLSPRLNWKLNEADNLSWQSFASVALHGQDRQERERTLLGAASEFPHNQNTWAAHATNWRNTVTWDRRLADSARLSVSAGWNYFQRDSRYRFWGRDAASVLKEERFVEADADEREVKFSGKYLAPYMENHVLSMGWDSSRGQRHETRDERDIRMDSDTGGEDSRRYQAAVRKLAAYVQDEWTLRPDLSAYLGLRWERVASQSSESGGFHVDNAVNMFSPIVQTVWKLSDKRQLRLALNRSFKAPALVRLVPRLFRIDNNNSQLNPDQQGNPDLRPEKAWGLDAAYEQYLPDGGVLSASLYARKIADLNREILFRRGDSWVQTPFNDGAALVMGMELEAKLGLRTLDPRWPAIQLRAHLARHWSRVERVPGPDNRLDGQIAMSASLGADYQLSRALSMGGDFGFQQAGALRESDFLRSSGSPTRNLDLYAIWRYKDQGQWRFTVANVLRQTRTENEVYQDQQERRWHVHTTPSALRWGLVWEQRY